MMKRLFSPALCLTIVAVLSMGAATQIAKGRTRPLTTKQMMAGLVKPNSAGLAEGLKQTPEDDKAWADLVTRAALLNESSYVMMDDDRCPDAVWENASIGLRSASAAVLEKLEAKDLEGAQEAMKGVSASCGACHKAHKK